MPGPERMAGRTVLITGGTGGIGKATAIGPRRPRGPGRHHRPGPPEGRGRRRRDPGGRRTTRRGVRGGHGHAGGGAATRHGRARRPPAAGRPRQQRRGLLEHPPRHGGRARAHVRAQPPGAVPAHPSARRPAGGERPGPRGHGVLRRAAAGPDRFRRSAGRALVVRAARLQPVQAGERAVHLRAGPPAARHRGHRDRAASRRRAHRVRRRGPRPDPAGDHPVHGPDEVPGAGRPTPIHLASSPEVEGDTGQFFANRKPRRSSKRSYDQADARRLWEVSAELVGLDPDTASRLGPPRRDVP